jgi:branched-chain amino acid transport system substrate-binding protein
MSLFSRASARLVALALAVAVLIGFTPTASRAADPFEIFSILPLTGPGAFAGKEQARTLQALEDYVNSTGGIRNRPIKFTVLDDASSPQQALQLMNQLIAKNVAAVVGPGFAGECGAVIGALANGPVSYCLSPGVHPAPGSYMYSTSFSTVDLIAVMVKYMREKGYKRIGIIAPTDASGQDGDKAIDAALADPANKDIVVVDREHFTPSDLSVAAQIARIKAATPQALIAWASGGSFGTVLRNAKEGGLDVPILTTPGNQTYEQMSAYAGFLPKDLLFCSGPFAAPDQVTDKTMKAQVNALYTSLAKLGARPGFPGQTDWDGGLLIVNAYRKIGFDATAAQIHDYIQNTRNYIGENGHYDFVASPQRGLDGSSTVIVRWDPTKGTWVAASKLGGQPL